MRGFHNRFSAACAIAIVSIALNHGPCLARGEYQTALDLYNKKDYGAAYQYFEVASLADPSNISANYYAGYSAYMAGRKNEASLQSASSRLSVRHSSLK